MVNSDDDITIYPLASTDTTIRAPIADRIAISAPPAPNAPLDTELIAANDLEWGTPIGSGAYGTVSNAKWAGRAVAVKVVTSGHVKKIRNEITMLMRLRHANVVELIGFGVLTNVELFIVMEFMNNGTLSGALHDTPKMPISFRDLTKWALQLATGLAFIHSQNIAHRDLKPSNILLTNQCQTLKIADFGSVREMADSEITKKVGTVIYMAPEVFDNANYTIACDVYSFGIILCEMFTRQRPYGPTIRESIDRNRAKFESEIKRVDSPLRPQFTASVPTAVSTMIQSCWATEKEKRKSMDAVNDDLKTFATDYFGGISVNQEGADDDHLLALNEHRCVSLFKRVCCSTTQNNRYSSVLSLRKMAVLALGLILIVGGIMLAVSLLMQAPALGCPSNYTECPSEATNSKGKQQHCFAPPYTTCCAQIGHACTKDAPVCLQSDKNESFCCPADRKDRVCYDRCYGATVHESHCCGWMLCYHDIRGECVSCAKLGLLATRQAIDK